MIVQWMESVASKRATLFVILAVCLILRLGIAVHSYKQTGDQPVAGSDSVAYIQIAHSLIDGRGFAAEHAWSDSGYKPTAGRDPLYPFFLAGVFAVFGNLLAVYLIQVILSTATTYLVFCLAGRVSRSPAVPALAAIFFTFYMPVALSVGEALTETLAAFLMTAAVYALVIGARRGVGHCAAAGAILGLVILNRGAMVFAPIVGVMVLLLARKEVKSWLPKAAVFVFTACIVVAPWTIRNYIVFDGFFPVSTYGSQMLWAGSGVADGHILAALGSAVDTDGVDRYKDPVLYPHVSRATYDKINRLQARYKQLDSEAKAEKLFLDEGIREIKEHPGRYLSLAPKKLVRLWTNLWFDKPPSKLSLAVAGANLLVLLLATVACVRGRTDRLFCNATMLLAAYISLVAMVFVGVVRFTYPLLPLLLLLAAAGFTAVMGDRSKGTVAAK